MLNKQYIKQIIKNVLNESNQNLIHGIQLLINQFLDDLRSDSEDWGLGEMDYLQQLEGIKEIEVKNIDDNGDLVVYVDIITNYSRYDFYLILEEINARLDDWFSGVKIKLGEVLVRRGNFGPGVDW